LLSRERDVDAFCEHPRRKRRGPPLPANPSGATPAGVGPSKKQTRNPPSSPAPPNTPHQNSPSSVHPPTPPPKAFETRQEGDPPLLTFPPASRRPRCEPGAGAR